MPSSISNFSAAARLAGAAMLAGLMLLMLYALTIVIHPVHVSNFVSQAERNAIVAERAIYAERAWRHIVVGSSMALLLPQYELGGTAYNYRWAAWAVRPPPSKSSSGRNCTRTRW